MFQVFVLLVPVAYVGPGIYALINHGTDTVIGTGIGSLLSGVGTGTGLLSRYCFW